MVSVPKSRRILQPVQPSEVPSCKFFLPCNEGGGNILRCPVTGAVWDAANGGHALQWGAVPNAVRMSINQDFNPTPFTSGAFPALSPTKYWNYIVAGRVIDILGTCRFALGDNDQLVYNPGYGWGFGDGLFHTAASSQMTPKTTMRKAWSIYPSEPDAGSALAGENVLAVDLTTDIITFSSTHSFVTGDVAFYNAISGFITPLVDSTEYYIIAVDTTRVKVATTKANALANVWIDLTAASITALTFHYISDIAYYGFGKNIVLVATYVPATSFGASVYDMDTGATILTTNLAMTGAFPASQSVTFSPCFRFCNFDMYGASLYESSVALPNLAAGAKTMAQNWRAGKKTLYAGWMGVT